MANLGMIFDPNTIEPRQPGDNTPPIKERQLSITEAESQFGEFIRSHGLNPPAIRANVGFQRFHTIGNKGKKNGWCVLNYFDGHAFGSAGCWAQDGKTVKWTPDYGRELTAAEKAEENQKRREHDQMVNRAEQAKHAEAAHMAREIWDASRSVGANHPYLIKKRVIPTKTLKAIPIDSLSNLIGYCPKNDGVTVEGQIIVMPYKSPDGNLSTLGFIDEAGRKNFLAGGKKKGAFWLAGDLPTGTGQGETILIGEGMATVLSAMAATGHFVIAAGDCHNLKPVAVTMRDRFPDATIIIIADAGNGQGDAENAAAAIRGPVVVPDFGPDRSENASDFNDLAASHGLDEVKHQIETVYNQTTTTQPAKWPAPDMRLVKSYSKFPPAIDTSIFPKPLDIWLQGAALGANAPVDFVAGNLLTASSSLIGMSRSASPHWEWIEPTILRNGNIAGPSGGKTPSQRPMLKPVRKIQAEYKKLWDADHEAWKNEKAACAIAQVPFDTPKPPKPRLIVTRGSTQRFEEILVDNPKGVLIVRDELAGLIGSMGEHSGAKDADRTFFIEGYNGDPTTTDTISRGETAVPHNATSIIGGIQPDKLHTALLTGDDDGFASRLIFIQAIPPEDDFPDKPCDHTAIETAFRRLAGLGREKDSYKVTTNFEKNVPLSEAAIKIFKPWWQKSKRENRKLAYGFFCSAHGKWPGTVLRLATTLEFLRWAVSDIAVEVEAPLNGLGDEPSEISKWAITAALYLVEEWIRPHYLYVLAETGSCKAEIGAKLLAKELLEREPDKINSREIYRTWKIAGLKTAEALDPVLDELVDAKWLLPVEQDPKRRPKGGRPPHNYNVNPRVYSS